MQNAIEGRGACRVARERPEEDEEEPAYVERPQRARKPRGLTMRELVASKKSKESKK